MSERVPAMTRRDARGTRGVGVSPSTGWGIAPWVALCTAAEAVGMTAAAGAAKASQALVGEASTGWPVAAALSLVLADHITARSRAAGRPLADIALPPGTVVASLVRDGTPTVPDGQCLLRPGDELLAVSGKASERDVHAAFQ